MTADARWPVARFCTCGASEESHDIRTDGTTRGKRVEIQGGKTVVTCTAFVVDREDPQVPRSELARRVDAVLALHVPGVARFVSDDPDRAAYDRCSCGWFGRFRPAVAPPQVCPSRAAATGVRA